MSGQEPGSGQGPGYGPEYGSGYGPGYDADAGYGPGDENAWRQEDAWRYGDAAGQRYDVHGQPLPQPLPEPQPYQQPYGEQPYPQPYAAQPYPYPYGHQEQPQPLPPQAAQGQGYAQPYPEPQPLPPQQPDPYDRMYEPTYEVTRDTGHPPPPDPRPAPRTAPQELSPYAHASHELAPYDRSPRLPDETYEIPRVPPRAQPQPTQQQHPHHPHPGPLPPEHHTPMQTQPQPHPHPQPHPQQVPEAPAGAGPGGAAVPPAQGEPRRSGSPIIAPGFRPAAVTVVLAALLAGTAQLGTGALTGAVVVLQALTAAGWYRLNGMWPARQGIALAFLAGISADVGLLLTDGDQAPTVLIGAIGIWCVLSLVLQLRNHSSPDERLYALTAGLAATGLTVLAAGTVPSAPDAVTVGAAAVGITVLARAVPLPPYVSPAIALLAAAGAGVACGQLTGMGTSGAVLGLAAGACALVGLRVASYDWPSRFVHMTAGVALPLTLAAPALYLLGRALT